MIEEVYDYLRKFGFLKEDLKEFENKNEKIYFANMKKIENSISFLMGKGLLKEEIINVARVNPFLLTTSDKRQNALDDIYMNELKISSLENKELLLLNPYMYSESPIELNKIINYLKSKNYTIEDIKRLVIENPKLLDLTLEEFKKTINN